MRRISNAGRWLNIFNLITEYDIKKKHNNHLLVRVSATKTSKDEVE